LRKQDIVGLLPGLITEAYRRANGDSDNISVVGMTWESQEDGANAADTEPMDTQFTTSSNTMELGGPVVPDDVTEEDIERAIAEIQDAIKKAPR
jgi:hypothetical protein